MSCKCKKTATDNQWAGEAAIGNTDDHVQKTEHDNEWVSTNKLADSKNPNKRKK